MAELYKNLELLDLAEDLAQRGKLRMFTESVDPQELRREINDAIESLKNGNGADFMAIERKLMLLVPPWRLRREAMRC